MLLNKQIKSIKTTQQLKHINRQLFQICTRLRIKLQITFLKTAYLAV